jgi:hypothetical protein
MIRAVALDAMGVVYTFGDDLRFLLIPFLRQNDCLHSDDEIVSAYFRCYRDGEAAATLWAEMAPGRDAEELEEAFLALYELTPGLFPFWSR